MDNGASVTSFAESACEFRPARSMLLMMEHRAQYPVAGQLVSLGVGAAAIGFVVSMSRAAFFLSEEHAASNASPRLMHCTRRMKSAALLCAERRLGLRLGPLGLRLLRRLRRDFLRRGLHDLGLRGRFRLTLVGLPTSLRR